VHKKAIDSPCSLNPQRGDGKDAMKKKACVNPFLAGVLISNSLLSSLFVSLFIEKAV